MADDALRSAVSALLAELLDGPPAGESYVLNPGDRGLLPSLDRLSAPAASAVPPSGGASIAAHVDHLRYGLSLMNRWVDGEENPFADANYSASWERATVTDEEWAERRAALAAEARRWTAAVRQARPRTDVERRGVVASVVHLAYHLGAIRQIDRAIRGPAASD